MSAAYWIGECLVPIPFSSISAEMLTFRLGNIIGVVFISSVSDRFGRRWCLMLGSILCLAGTGLATGASEAGMFIAGRLLLGIGGVITGAIGPMWMGELAYPAHRATATSMSNTTYSAGSILSAWVTFGSFHMASSWYGIYPLRSSRWEYLLGLLTCSQGVAPTNYLPSTTFNPASNWIHCFARVGQPDPSL